MTEFYTIRFWDGKSLSIKADYKDVLEQVSKLSPSDVAGFEKFLKDAGERYRVAFESSENNGKRESQ